MPHPVQHRYDHAPLTHSRRNRFHGTIKIVGLTTQQNNIVGPLQLALLNSRHLGAELAAVLQLYDQAIPLQLPSPLGSDQKRHISPALKEHSAKISTERARTQHQVPHLFLPKELPSRRCIKACRTTVPLGSVPALGIRDRMERPRDSSLLQAPDDRISRLVRFVPFPESFTQSKRRARLHGHYR